MLWSKMRCFSSLWIISLILVGCGSETVTSHDPTASIYQPTPPQPQAVGARLVGPIIYTVDARSSDVWMYFDFARGSVVPVQESKTWHRNWRSSATSSKRIVAPMQRGREPVES